MGNKIRVGIIDSETLFRAGIALHLSAQGDMEVVNEAAALRDAIRLASDLNPDDARAVAAQSGAGRSPEYWAHPVSR